MINTCVCMCCSDHPLSREGEGGGEGEGEGEEGGGLGRRKYSLDHFFIYNAGVPIRDGPKTCGCAHPMDDHHLTDRMLCLFRLHQLV